LARKVLKFRHANESVRQRRHLTCLNCSGERAETGETAALLIGLFAVTVTLDRSGVTIMRMRRIIAVDVQFGDFGRAGLQLKRLDSVIGSFQAVRCPRTIA